jgi:hypothetical protein
MTAKPCIDAPITDPMFNETDHPFLVDHPGGCWPLPGPDLHRLDQISLS